MSKPIDLSTTSSESELSSDICIIGSGGASSMLCRSLSDAPYSIIVLESGDFHPEEGSPYLKGKNIGKYPFSIGGQRRRVGGGMNDWSGNCSLLEREDFETNDDFPINWPITFDDLGQYATKVEDFLELTKRFGKDSLVNTSKSNSIELGLNPESSSQFCEKLFIRSNVRAPISPLNSTITQSANLRVITGASVGDLALSDSKNQVKRIIAHRGDEKIVVNSTLVILAAGIENAPILMRTLGDPNENESHPLPVLGQYLHSHLLSLRGFFIPTKKSKELDGYCLPGDLGQKGKERAKSFKGIQVSSGIRRNKKILNGTMFLSPVTPEALLIPDQVYPAAKELLSKEKYSKSHPIYAVRHFIEQVPQKANRVSLGTIWGSSPFQRPEYNWDIHPAEEKTMSQNVELLSEFMAKSNLGKVFAVSCGEENDSSILSSNAHPMGGTIMGTTSENSVVDANCKVHGFDNLYVVGGSVIPRSGAAMVTGVILQLSLRLADHVKNLLGNQPR